MKQPKRIVRIKFGSHLYGTATPASDLDFKSVYVPPARDILLQRVKASISTQRPKAEGEKNYAGEIDEESYSLQRYLDLIAEGQTVALDILFAPSWSMTDEPSWEWREITANRDRLITRKSAAFVGYCRQQANKYGIKGSRVAAARRVLELLRSFEPLGSTAKLREADAAIRRLIDETGHMAIVPILQVSGETLDHWEVCGRKLSYAASIKHARDVVQKLVDDYGHRALEAERQEGVDWKALSHAVRVATEAIEVLGTGRVTFPLPNAAHVLAIKLGRLPYQAVAEDIERLLGEVEEAAARSTLRDEPDREWIDDFVANVHAEQVRQYERAR
jgi:predicted nucleotidyltransferase